MLAFFTILLAIVIATARFTLPFVKDYRGEIESQLSSLLKRPVEIGSIDVAWEGFHPVVAFRDVTIRDKSEQQDVFHFDSLSLSLHLRESLRQLRPVLRTLFLRGGDVAVRRTLDGRFAFKGLSGFDRPMGSSTEGLEAFEHLSVRLSDIRLIWQDEPLKHNWEFYSEGIDLVVWEGGVSVDAELTLPVEMGSRFKVTAIALGDLSDYRSWNGHFFVDLDKLNLAAYPLVLPPSIPRVSNGVLAAKMWGNWRGVDELEAEGKLEMSHLQIIPPKPDTVASASPVNDQGGAQDNSATEASAAPLADAEAMLEINFLRSRVRWEQRKGEWHLDMDQTRLSIDDKVWPETGLSLAQKNVAGARQTELAMSYADIESFSRLARILPSVTLQQRTALTEMAPHGSVSAARGRINQASDALTYDVQARLRDVGWQEYGKIPGVEGVDAVLEANERGGEASMSVSAGAFESSRLFEAPFEISSLTSALSWEASGDDWNILADDIHLENPDVTAFSTARVVTWKGKEPALYLEAGIPRVALNRVDAYLPYGIIKPKVARWLRHAFQQGYATDARVSYAGELSKQAFKQGDSTLLAELSLEQGGLHYRDDYPDAEKLGGRVSFHNASIHGELSSGEVLGVEVGEAQFSIQDLYKARLNLELQTKGPLPGYLAYLRKSPLSKGREALLDSVTSSGEASLALLLDIPLSKKIPEPLSLDGKLRLAGNTLAMPGHDLEFAKARGDIHFTEHSYDANGLKAQFRDEPVAAGMVTRDDGTVVVSLLGDFTVPQLLPEYTETLSPWVSGMSSWSARVEIPRHHPPETGQPPVLWVESDLEGIHVGLPSPMGKPALEKKPFRLSWELGEELPEVTLDYGDFFMAKALMHEVGGKQTIHQAEVQLGGVMEEPDWQGEGIGIRGEIERLALNDWITTLMAMHRDDAEPLDIRVANVRVGELDVIGQQVKDIDILAARKPGGWQLDLNASQVAGEVFWPDRWKQRWPVTAKLDHLILMRNGRDVQGQLKPRDLPSLEVEAKKFQWGDLKFEWTTLSTVRSGADWIIKKAQFESDSLALEASGAWLDKGENVPQSRLRLNAHGKNLGATIADLDLTSALGDGKGQLSADVSWSGPPYLPDFASMSGTVSVDVRDGRLKDIDPGLGRLLGLLNLDSLPKRLALNFKDIAVEGFQYDTIKGKGAIDAGILHLNNLVMDGSAATITISGDTHIVQQGYDLDVNLVPKFKSAVPLMAGALVAPQTGVVLFVADKLAEALGVDFNESATISYKVKGTWEAPEVETVQGVIEPPEPGYDLPG